MDQYSSYAKKLALLRKELSVIRASLRKKKKDFNEHQLKMYDFISNTFDHGRFLVVLSKDRNGHWIVSYYKVEEVGKGDCS